MANVVCIIVAEPRRETVLVGETAEEECPDIFDVRIQIIKVYSALLIYVIQIIQVKRAQLS